MTSGGSLGSSKGMQNGREVIWNWGNSLDTTIQDHPAAFLLPPALMGRSPSYKVVH